MNSNISRQKKLFNWNSNDRLLKLSFKYFHPAVVKVKINKPMTKLSWKDIEDSMEQIAYNIEWSCSL